MCCDRNRGLKHDNGDVVVHLETIMLVNFPCLVAMTVEEMHCANSSGNLETATNAMMFLHNKQNPSSWPENKMYEKKYDNKRKFILKYL